jgi:Putative bacterial sensory transduction regulator
MRSICALIVLLTLPLAARADSLPDGGVTAPDVAAALKSAGYPADVTADRSGQPYIRSSTGKVLFLVHFYQCGSELRCASVEFIAPFRHKYSTQAAIGAWNREKRFGRAFLDSHGAAWLAMDVETIHGMTTEALEADVKRWTNVMSEFEAFVAR